MKKIFTIISLSFFVSSFTWFWESEPKLYTNINNTELQQLLKKGVPLIDIRLPEEWRQTGVIKGSTKMTLFGRNGRMVQSFLPRFTKLDKNKPVILICKTGSRSKVASKFLAEKLGYKKIYNVKNGIFGWLKDKLPVVR
ncbi:Rhodanese-like domain protein [hydrothermal vent metagenome]|uniref:Rhodanese-like domain protein n=1 Tax=hydrothermal vent metagenome TaxID=652676 RepID=A0A1W1C3Q9_9ZZZZ